MRICFEDLLPRILQKLFRLTYRKAEEYTSMDKNKKATQAEASSYKPWKPVYCSV
jgi:hypothetical protein